VPARGLRSPMAMGRMAWAIDWAVGETGQIGRTPANCPSGAKWAVAALRAASLGCEWGYGGSSLRCWRWWSCVTYKRTWVRCFLGSTCSYSYSNSTTLVLCFALLCFTTRTPLVKLCSRYTSLCRPCQTLDCLTPHTKPARKAYLKLELRTIDNVLLSEQSASFGEVRDCGQEVFFDQGSFGEW